MRHAIFVAVVFLSLSLFPILPARADAIDGTWCKQSQTMQIDGPAIVTPGGHSIQGEYNRHAFRYVVPAGEPAAGQRVDMILMDEYDVQVKVGDTEPVVWKRCAPTS